MRWEIAVPPSLRYCLITVAKDLLWRGPSIILIIFLQIVAVGWLSSQFWRVSDNFTRWEWFAACKPLRVLLSAPSRAPISYHLEETEDRNCSRTWLCGSESVTRQNKLYTNFRDKINLVIRVCQDTWRYLISEVSVMW